MLCGIVYFCNLVIIPLFEKGFRMLKWFDHLRLSFGLYFNMLLVGLGFTIGLCAASLGWGVLGVFALGFILAKTFVLPGSDGQLWTDDWRSNFIDPSKLHHQFICDNNHENKKSVKRSYNIDIHPSKDKKKEYVSYDVK